MYSQSNEEEILLSYFKDYKEGTILSIGENNGKHLSNSLALIEQYNFSAVLVEPSPKVFPSLCGLHLHRDNVYCLQLAVSDYNGKADFYDSGTHLNKGDNALLSSLSKEEIKRWGNSTTFEKVKVDVVDFKTLMKLSPIKEFTFISIDAEGEDLIIAKQINLKELNCKAICIEWNSNPKVLSEILSYCAQFGLGKVLLTNAENVILGS